MPGFFSRLFGGGNKQSTPALPNNNTLKPNIPGVDPLLFRASHNFNKYLTNFLQTGASVGLPVSRLSREEWNSVNEKLAKQGVTLVSRYDNGIEYMWFEYLGGASTQLTPLEKLMARASKNFSQYMQECLSGTSDSSALLPTKRMEKSDWDELNRLLADQGIQLIPVMYEGMSYMKVARANPQKLDNSNVSAFSEGVVAVKERAFEQIKQQYPNLSDEVVHYIVDNNDKLSANDIYKAIRHAMRPYDTPQSQFIQATQYGSQHTNDIMVFSYQNWTFSRKAKRRVSSASKICMYHLSLNVHVVPGLIAALDDVLARDMGQYIDYYKFPKANWFDEVQYRHDPVTIYMYDRNSDIEQQIVAAVAPYVRSNEGLLGQVLGPGVDINTETSSYGGVSVGQSIAMKIKNILDSVRE
ncbi:MAG: hypothetical protein K2M34_02165 [Alphaproteobacteria bacterium]|nr:hypothetical protein [Alphaproteobacteria bacterium]